MTSDLLSFLKVCDGLKETDFHKRIVEPLLVELGASNIEYTHGPNERGKDFFYMMPRVMAIANSTLVW